MACVVNMEVDIKDVCPVQHTDRKYGETHARNCKHLCSSIFSTSHLSYKVSRASVLHNPFFFQKTSVLRPFCLLFIFCLPSLYNFPLYSAFPFGVFRNHCPALTRNYTEATQEETMCHKCHKDLWQWHKVAQCQVKQILTLRCDL